MKNQEIKIEFSLVGIVTEQFALIEEKFCPNTEVEMGVRFDFKLNKEAKQVGVFLSLEFLQKKEIFIKIVVSCHFRIGESSWAQFEKKDSTVIPKGFLSHIAMITTGTTRGVLFSKTESTPFSKFFVPTLNVDSMITKDAIFQEIANDII